MSTDFVALKKAVRAVLSPVPRVGKIEIRVGGIPTWAERLGVGRAFWELAVASATEQEYAASDSIWEDLVVRAEVVMPFSYDENTEGLWDALIPAGKDALRANPLLVVDGVPFFPERWRNFGIPSLTVNDRVDYCDGVKIPLCHHAVIEIRYRNDFDYTVE